MAYLRIGEPQIKPRMIGALHRSLVPLIPSACQQEQDPPVEQVPPEKNDSNKRFADVTL
jgi:hypothetical protein